MKVLMFGGIIVAMIAGMIVCESETIFPIVPTIVMVVGVVVTVISFAKGGAEND